MAESRMRRHLAALAAIALALAGYTGWPAAAAAQTQPPVTLEVHAGYDGGYRLSEWFAVEVNVANDGPDISAVLEWSFPNYPDEQIFQRRIDLPRGARKRMLLDVFANGFVRNGQVRLLDGAVELARQDIALASYDMSVFLIGVVSSDPALLNSLSALQLPNFASARVVHIGATALPESAAELRGLNALFLHDLDSAALSAAQREALSLWAGQGGQLVVSGGVNAQKATAGLIDLLPVQSVGAPTQADLAGLGQLAGGAAPAPAANATLSQAQPRPTAEQLPASSGLIYRWQYGAGAVIFSGFDLSSLRGWSGEGALWARLLPQPPTLIPGAGATLNQFNLLDRGVLKLPSLDLPSTLMILLFLLGYVLVIGPLNYVVLRRMRRLELAWLTIPLIVVVFGAGLYLVGRVLRGGQAQFNQVAVVQGVEGQSRGGATAFISLFSPSRSSYALTLPAATLVSSGSSRAFLGNRLDTIAADEAGVRTLDVLADVASVTTFVAEAAVDLPIHIQTNLTLNSTGVQGQIRNTGTTVLEDVAVVRGDQFVRLGALAPGAEQQVASASLRPNFPNGMGLTDSGVFDRQAMVNLLFDRDAARSSSSGPPASGFDSAEGAYLLAWVNQPALAVGQDGQAAPQTGLTLYVIRLQAALGR